MPSEVGLFFPMCAIVVAPQSERRMPRCIVHLFESQPWPDDQARRSDDARHARETQPGMEAAVGLGVFVASKMPCLDCAKNGVSLQTVTKAARPIRGCGALSGLG